MPGRPEEDSESGKFNTNLNTVREITQTDHLNKKLLTSYLNNINTRNNSSDKTPDKPEKHDEDEEQNWDP